MCQWSLEEEGGRANIHGILTMSLITTGVDGSARQALVVEVVVNSVDGWLRVAEDQGASGLLKGEEVVIQSLELIVRRSLDDVLLDILVGLTATAETDAIVVFSHQLPSQGARVLGEGGRKEQEDVVGVLVGVCGGTSAT